MVRKLILLMLCGSAFAAAPHEDVTNYPGGLYCKFYNDKNKEVASTVLLWSQLTDIDGNTMKFTTKDGIVTLSYLSEQTWICTPIGRGTRKAQDIE